MISGGPQKKLQQLERVGPQWSDSSDDEDERRVVRSAKDKQWTNLQQIIKTMTDRRKIEDFAQVQEGGSDQDSSETSSESSSEDESSSDLSSDDEDGKAKDSASEDSDDNEWGSSSDESVHEEPGKDVDRYDYALERWGKKTDDKKAKPDKAKVKDKEKAAPKIKAAKQVPEAIDADLISKKLQEVTALRGRKGFDRIEQIRHLHELADAAKSVGSKNVLEVLGHLISAYFDANFGKRQYEVDNLDNGAFACMPSQQWMLCYQQIDSALSILRKEKDCYFPFLIAEEEEEESALEPETEGTSTAALLKVQQEGGDGEMKESKARMSTALICTSFLERLDDELTKALQLTDVHAVEYKVRLGQTVDILALLWKAYIYSVSAEQAECSRIISLRILEQIYYKNDAIASRMWELVKKRLQHNDVSSLSGDFAANKIVPNLCRQVLESSADIKIKTRVVLYLAYYESLHGYFYDARDLLQTANVQELASQCNISTQILYNRNLVQLGLSAFRLGLISEAHNYLSEVCAMGRYKELLAQGLSNPRGVEKSPEQERLEKRRLLPYHMHIAADLVEAVHNM
ncbi:uncharacterized protein LOC129617666 [Condylostylus longicornis]|uniref:uncharacterized protein LOC129617666 n=1 Tax=Condylostylus longicornis TaxID=2530218 RepID=UPI00244DBEB2|nr:uncharacterized protein LOC129617666 [Condylostylus longicornis]